MDDPFFVPMLPLDFASSVALSFFFSFVSFSPPLFSLLPYPPVLFFLFLLLLLPVKKSPAFVFGGHITCQPASSGSANNS